MTPHGEWKVEVCRDATSVRRLLPEWAEIFWSRASELPVFAHPAFLLSRLDVESSCTALRLVVVRDCDGAAELIVPLESASPSVWHGLGSGAVDYQFVLQRGNADAPWLALRHFFEQQKEASEWAVRQLPEESPWHWRAEMLGAPLTRNPEEWLRPGVHGLWKENREHPFLRGQRLHAAAEKLDAATMRRHRNWFEKRGSFTHESIIDSAKLARSLPDFFDLHVREWKSRGQDSEFSSIASRQHFSKLYLKLAEDGLARLDCLFSTGEMVAAHAGFVWQGKFHYYKPAFAPEFGRHSPGTLLTRQMIRCCLEEGLEEFDFLAGRESYKDDYDPEIRATWTLRWFRNRRSVAWAAALRLLKH